MPHSTLSSFLRECQHLLPARHALEPGNAFYWSPRQKTVYFHPQRLTSNRGKLVLLHEISHALLGHHTYRSDIELLQLEVAAWDKARDLAQKYRVAIDDIHIQDCLDTYRDWLYARSTCPTCTVSGLQTSRSLYQCVNCATTWSVSPSRFCRTYRMRTRSKKTPSGQSQTVFQ